MYLVRSPEDLGRAIAELRRDQQLSQAQLAEKAGVDRTYIAKLEGGHRSALLDLIFDVLAELDANITVARRNTSDHG
jgi:HTH-type transcriptional regulator/antitoxin HipB